MKLPTCRLVRVAITPPQFGQGLLVVPAMFDLHSVPKKVRAEGSGLRNTFFLELTRPPLTVPHGRSVASGFDARQTPDRRQAERLGPCFGDDRLGRVVYVKPLTALVAKVQVGELAAYSACGCWL